MVEPKKLKVAELREELKSRGIDSKGNKAQLVKRLEKALKQEAGESGDDSQNETLETSTLETSTEEHEESLNQTENIEPDSHDTEPGNDEVITIAEDNDKPVDEVAQEAQEETDKKIEEENVEQQQDQESDEEMEETQPVEKEEPEDSKPVEQEEPEDSKPVAKSEEIQAGSGAEKVEPKEEEPQVHEQPQMKEPEPAFKQEEASIKQEDTYKQEMEQQHAEEPPKFESKFQMKTEVNIAPDVHDEEEEQKTEQPMEEQSGAEEQQEAPGQPKEENVAMDATTNGDDRPAEDSAEKTTGDDAEASEDKESRKRRRSRSRSRDRHHRSKHSRSRSPRRRRSRSHERKRSGSRERRHSPDRRRRSRSPRQRVSRFDSPRQEPEENEDWINATNLQWDRFNCDLHVRISDDGYKCNPITVEGFAFMWAGVRSNYGFNKGKVAYECKILEHLNVNHLPEEETSRHVVRVGYSTDNTTMQLGEEKFSYGYGGTRKASTDCKFSDFGTTFGQGDAIGCYLDFEGEKITIAYTKNGEDLGVCFEIEKEDLGEAALFAHVLTKNCEFDVNFGQKEEPFFPLKEGFVFLNDVPEAERVRGTLPPSKKEDCEIIMMCGLPGAGKTVWATKYFQEHKDNRFHVLGTNNIIDKMKVMGLPRKRNYAGRWDILIDKSTKCLNRLLEIASKKKRNYILDQTNVYPSAQRRKMRPFEGFQRRAVVIVPDDEEFKKRCEKREKEEGKEIPDIAVWEMKANFCLPEEGQSFDKVEFIELQREEAKEVVDKYNKEGEANLPADYKRYRKYDNRSSSYGGGGGNRYGGGGDRRDYRDRDGGGYHGGGGRYDNRDNRDRGGRGGGWRGNRGGGGSYMGYSSNDRQRYSDKDNRDNRSYNKDYRSGGRSNYNNYGGGGGGRQNYNKQGYGSGGSGGSSNSWGNQQQQGSWDSSQQQQGSWGGQQGGWGNQGTWGQPAYNQGWGQQQWGNYQQPAAAAQTQQSAATTAQQWQNYYNQYQYPQQSGWGNYNYGYGQQQGTTDQTQTQVQPKQ